MKVLLTIFVTLPILILAQNSPTGFKNTSGHISKMFYFDSSQNCKQHRFYEHVEQMPAYKNGLKSLEKELNKNLKPTKGQKYLLRLVFTVNCEGKAYGFQVANGKDSVFDINLINTIEKLQNWTAGEQNGRIVDCGYILVMDIKRGRIIIRNIRD